MVKDAKKGRWLAHGLVNRILTVQGIQHCEQYVMKEMLNEHLGRKEDVDMCQRSLNYCLTQGKYTKIDHREELHHSSGGYYTRVVNKGALDQVVE